MIYIITYLGIIHWFVTNPCEKCFFQNIGHDGKRPLAPNLSNALEHYGMPSGHTEITTIVCLLLLHYDYIDWVLAIIVIVLMGLQRIISKRHSLLQVFAGFLFGLIFYYIYVYLENPVYIIWCSVLIPIAIIFIIMAIIESKLYKPLPEWIKPESYSIINKKRDISLYDKLMYIGTMITTHHGGTLYMSWSELESYLDSLILLVSNKKFDCVVGIKSGGAIISNYISWRLNLPNYYMKISTKCDKTMIDNYQKTSTYTLCEDISGDVTGKRVLLVDECINSGGTISECIKYLKYKKAYNIVTACIQNHSGSDTENSILYLNREHTIIWPWGYDN